MKANVIFIFGFVLIQFLLTSCDGWTGLEGVVKDKYTGENITNVKVIMSSDYETINTETDSSGYFHAIDHYTCSGTIINKCDDSFTIRFEKEGYETLQLNNSYESDPGATQLKTGLGDSVLIEMIPIVN